MSTPHAAPAEIVPAAHRQEIERRLAPGYRLDGTFESLWAVELFLRGVRQVGALYREAPSSYDLNRVHCPWLGPYLRALFARAFHDMRLEIAPTEEHLLWTRQPPYGLNLADDCARLLQPTTPFPTLFGLTWEPREPLGVAAAPWYGLATVMQNQEWAQGQHRPLNQCRDHLDRGLWWLVQQHVWAATSGHPPWQEPANALFGALLWPPLGYPGNERGEHNFPRLTPLLKASSDVAAILRRAAVSQDMSVSLLASAACLHHGVVPASILEAIAFRRAIEYFGFTPAAAITEEIDKLAPPPIPADVSGSDHPRFLLALEKIQSDKPAARRLLDQLTDALPENAFFWSRKAQLCEAMSDLEEAVACYGQAVAIDEQNHAALLGRAGLLARGRQLDASDADLFKAQALRPGDGVTRDRLVLNYLARQIPR